MKDETKEKIKSKIKEEILAFTKEEDESSYRKELFDEIVDEVHAYKNKWKTRKSSIGITLDYQREITLSDAKADSAASKKAMGDYYLSRGKEDEALEMYESVVPCYATSQSVLIINKLGDLYSVGKSNPQFEKYKRWLKNSIESFKYDVSQTKDYSGLKVPLIVFGIAIILAIVFAFLPMLATIIQYAIGFGLMAILFVIPGFVGKKIFRIGNFLMVLLFIAFSFSAGLGIVTPLMPYIVQVVEKYIGLIRTILVAGSVLTAGISALVALKKYKDVESGKNYEKTLRKRYNEVISDFNRCKHYIKIRLVMCDCIETLKREEEEKNIEPKDQEYSIVKDKYKDYYKKLEKEFKNEFSNYSELLIKYLKEN